MPLPFRRPQACLAMLLLWGAATAQAQSLRQLYEAALGYDATYQSALASARASQARADQARAGLLPQVGMQAGAQHNWSETSVLGGSSSRAFSPDAASAAGNRTIARLMISAAPPCSSASDFKWPPDSTALPKKRPSGA